MMVACSGQLARMEQPNSLLTTVLTPYPGHVQNPLARMKDVQRSRNHKDIHRHYEFSCGKHLPCLPTTSCRYSSRSGSFVKKAS